MKVLRKEEKRFIKTKKGQKIILKFLSVMGISE